MEKNISEALKGKSLSEEAKQKISISNKGRKLSKEQCLQISQRMKTNHPFKNKKHSKESKEKMSLNGSGNKPVKVITNAKEEIMFRNLGECLSHFEKIGLDKAIIKKNLNNLSPIYFEGMKSNSKKIIENRKKFKNYHFEFIN